MTSHPSPTARNEVGEAADIPRAPRWAAADLDGATDALSGAEPLAELTALESWWLAGPRLMRAPLSGQEPRTSDRKPAVAKMPGPGDGGTSGGGDRGAGGADQSYILVIDPDPDGRLITSALLAASGLRVISAGCGDAALGALRRASRVRAGDGDGEGAFAAVVSELYVPAAGEPCALRAVKRHATHARLPFLVYSAHVGPADRNWALDNGCDAYLPKPSGGARLSYEVERLLRPAD